MTSAGFSHAGSHMEKLWNAMLIYCSLTHHSIIGNTVVFTALSITCVALCDVRTQGAENRTQHGPVPLSLFALKYFTHTS